MKRSVFAIIFACVLVLSIAATAFADDTGSISVAFKHNDAPVSGGSLTLYLIALPEGNEFVYCESFAGCGYALDDLHNESLAQDLADFATMMAIPGQTLTMDEQGYACFEDLQSGLYLLVQETAAEGFVPVAPFLVTLPGPDGEMVVDATPKMSLLTQIPQTEPPTEPEPTEPADPSVPQTGQLNWPVPLLAVGGLLIFMFGWYLNRTGRREN